MILRDKVVRYKVGDYVEHDIEEGYAVRDICVVGTNDLDSLLAASHAEGVAEGEAKVVGQIKQLAQGTEWFDMLSVLAPKEKK